MVSKVIMVQFQVFYCQYLQSEGLYHAAGKADGYQHYWNLLFTK